MYRTSKHTQQLGVGGLLGGELLIVQTTVIYISAGKTGLVTLTLAGCFSRNLLVYMSSLSAATMVCKGILCVFTHNVNYVESKRYFCSGPASLPLVNVVFAPVAFNRM